MCEKEIWKTITLIINNNFLPLWFHPQENQLIVLLTLFKKSHGGEVLNKPTQEENSLRILDRISEFINKGINRYTEIERLV